MLIREVEVMQKLDEINNNFSPTVKAIFANEEAHLDSSQLREVYLVTEYVPYSLEHLLSAEYLEISEE